MTLQDFVYDTYNSLLLNGWRMSDIDSMDMLGYYKVRAWNSKKEQTKSEPKPAYIDNVWGQLSPGCG